MSNAVAVTSSEFDQQVLKSETPVIVDFWAVWCGPCRMIAPHLDALATEYAGKVKVVKVNIDDEREVTERYGVQSIPTLFFFKDGKVVDQVVGAVPKNVIASKLDALL